LYVLGEVLWWVAAATVVGLFLGWLLFGVGRRQKLIRERAEMDAMRAEVLARVETITGDVRELSGSVSALTRERDLLAAQLRRRELELGPQDQAAVALQAPLHGLAAPPSGDGLPQGAVSSSLD